MVGQSVIASRRRGNPVTFYLKATGLLHLYAVRNDGTLSRDCDGIQINYILLASVTGATAQLLLAIRATVSIAIPRINTILRSRIVLIFARFMQRTKHTNHSVV